MNLKAKRGLVSATILALFIAIVLPSVAFADQNRGRGQERRHERRDDRDDRNFKRDKRKQAKFVNWHDARDGRWDGRGPRRNRSLNRSELRRYRYRDANRTRRRSFNLYDQDISDRSYQNDRYREPSRDILGGILGTILGGQ